MLARVVLPHHHSRPTAFRAAIVAQLRKFSSSSLASSTDAADTRWKVAKVPHRGIVEVSGRDTVKLLQGLVSNDVKALESSKSTPTSPPLVYAGFMNPQGRMLADVFVHRQQPLDDGSPRWLLDLDSRTLPSLLSFIKKFKLRSKVKLVDVSSEYSVIQAWSSSGSPSPTELTDKLSADPRCPTIGLRGVLPAADGLHLGQSVSAVESEEYTLHRIINGVAEGALDFPEASSMPLENNLDYMNGVDFRKGCYVGQELTARTHHTGVVRKRIVPITFYLSDTPAPTSITDVDRSFAHPLPAHLAEVRSKPINPPEATGGKPARGKAAGKFTQGIHNVGLACLRLEQVNRWTDASKAGAESNGLELSITSGDGETTLLVRPWIPGWWPKEEPLPSNE
ncbi:hypothetical protein EX895_001447 [Sporisorium graminicola]|uniref:CAF17 C-terminal domain-containing protein n=1 Tax=Sporisorium graminicola TaxID=280036 RepID=A0A4U7L2V8_9BASI|nr:hypothetical protein EX895_001447 [Sporisorium graminicola]TKY89662.1 hypothetical protein EX895_001447 [Sporisorium graminicola]